MLSPGERPWPWVPGAAAPGPGAVCPRPLASTASWGRKSPPGPPPQASVTLDQRKSSRQDGYFHVSPGCCEFPRPARARTGESFCMGPAEAPGAASAKRPPARCGQDGLPPAGRARTARTGCQRTGMGGGERACFSPCPSLQLSRGSWLQVFLQCSPLSLASFTPAATCLLC